MLLHRENLEVHTLAPSVPTPIQSGEKKKLVERGIVLGEQKPSKQPSGDSNMMSILLL